MAETLARVTEKIGSVRRSLPPLAEALGLPGAETIANTAYLLAKADQALALKAPLNWLGPGAAPKLIRRFTEARSQHETYAADRARLMERYTELLFRLNLPALHARFSQDYAAPIRLLNPNYHAELRIVRSVAKEALPGPAELVRDLADAQAVVVRQQWIALNEDELSATYGSYYEGSETDWEALLAALRGTKELLKELPGEEASESLRRALSSAGPERQALSERAEQTRHAFAALGEALRALGAHLQIDRLPFTDLPLPQAPLPNLWAWTDRLRESAADYGEAIQLALSARRDPSDAIPAARLRADVAQAAASLRDEEAESRGALALRARFGPFYSGAETDWKTLLDALRWTQSLRALFPDEPIPPDFASLVSKGDSSALADIAAQRPVTAARRVALAKVESALEQLFPIERLQAEGHALPAAPLAAFADWLRARSDRLPDLERWLDLQNLRAECERAGLLSFFETVAHHLTPPEEIAPAFQRRFTRLWLDAVLDANLVLRSFRGKDQDARIAKFAALDRLRIENAPEEVRALAQTRRPVALFNIGEAAVLRAHLRRKRVLPIRSLLAQIPNLLACLKPCLLMSPLSVSLFLDPERIEFDLVIFDEASQLFPQDAVGALLRAPQAVIAGDGRQLPPTSFFLTDLENESDDENPLSGEFESVLDAANSLASEHSPHFARRSLCWHYRSQQSP